MARNFPTPKHLEELQQLNRKIKNRGGNVAVVPKVNKKINEKINKISTIKTQNAKSGVGATWEAAQRQHENRARAEFGIAKQETVKVDSNPVKPGKTRIGNLAGGGLGGMFGIKNR